MGLLELGEGRLWQEVVCELKEPVIRVWVEALRRENGLSWVPSRNGKKGVACSLEEGSRVSLGHILETLREGAGFAVSEVGRYRRGFSGAGVRRCLSDAHSVHLWRG